MGRLAYKIRSIRAGSAKNPYTAYAITLPARLVAMIKEADEKEFEPRLVPASSTHRGGILLELVERSGGEEEVPEWAR